MVDPIGSKPVTKVATTPVAPVSAAKSVAASNPQVAGDVAASSLVATTREMASKPPVDAERVAQIKQAIADGNFPIVPAKIADRLIAFKLNWNPNEPA